MKYKHTCNYCHKDMEYHTDARDKLVSVCTRPECPAYALLQITTEQMPKEKEVKDE